MKMLLVIMMSLSLFACSKNDDRMKEKAAIESESSTASQLRVENENLANKAEKMEKDLAKKNRFYQALKGTYEGTMTTNLGTTKVSIDFSPSKSIFPVTRVRQLEEIASDLNELFLTAHVVQSDPNNPNAAVGCAGIKVVDDIPKGELTISSATCPNLYKIKVTERGFSASVAENEETASRVARDVLAGYLDEVDSVNGEIKSTTYAGKVKFTANKIAE